MEKEDYQKMENMYIPKELQESETSKVSVIVIPAGKEIEDRYRQLLKIVEQNE